MESLDRRHGVEGANIGKSFHLALVGHNREQVMLSYFQKEKGMKKALLGDTSLR